MIGNYQQLLEETKTKVLALVELKPENQWTLDTNKDGYTIYTKINPENGLNIGRTETNTTVDPEAFISLVMDQTKRKEFDSNFAEGKIIEKVDENTQIYHTKGKPPAMLVSARDFCFISRVYKLGEGNILAINKSIEHPAVPPVKGFERGEVVFQALMAKKQPNGQTNIVVIAHMNPKGDLPKALINQGVKQQAELVKKALEYLAKHHK